jgi:RNA polymerase sigma factor (sigma-70 family)
LIENSLSDFCRVGYYMGEMQPKSDAQLLREYAERGTEAAFSELVHRHTNLVYSAALRQVESPEAAAEIAQSVFVGLVRGARSLLPRLAAEASLAGWLCRSARNLSLNFRRDEFRRHTRERHVMEQLSSVPEDAPDWDRLRLVLDDAMSELNETDYDALVLRFYQNQDFRMVGAAIGVSDDTAQKRVARALEKLRDILSQRGIRTTTIALSVVIAANAVQSAPVGLAATITAAAALVGTAVTTSTAIAITKTIAMTTLQKTFITVTVAALAGAGIFEARQAAKARAEVQELQQQQTALSGQIQKLQSDGDDASNRLIALRDENQRLKTNVAALARFDAKQQTAANVGASQQPPSNVLSSTNSQTGSIELPKNSWVNAGFATPESALKTRGWSVLTGNREVFAESLSITPGARKILEDMILQLAQASNDPNKNQLIQQAITEKWGVEEAILMPMMALNQRQGFAGYRIVSEQTPAPDQMIMDVETETTSGLTHSDTLKFQQIGGDWKVVIDEDTLKRGH